jgi:hypothetical protein
MSDEKKIQESQLDKPGGHFPPNYWDAILWMFQDMIGAAYEPIMADTVAPGDIVIVAPREEEGQLSREPVSVGRVTEVNFADSAREGQTAYNSKGWLVKVRDLRPNNSTIEGEYGTDAYSFFKVDPDTVDTEEV